MMVSRQADPWAALFVHIDSPKGCPIPKLAYPSQTIARWLFHKPLKSRDRHTKK